MHEGATAVRDDFPSPVRRRRDHRVSRIRGILLCVVLLGGWLDPELKELIDRLTEEEEKVSYRRRILHGKIDILRAELVNRLRKKREEGESVISGADVQQLTDILMGKTVVDGSDR